MEGGGRSAMKVKEVKVIVKAGEEENDSNQIESLS
jgi:hypothetical protein